MLAHRFLPLAAAAVLLGGEAKAATYLGEIDATAASGDCAFLPAQLTGVGIERVAGQAGASRLLARSQPAVNANHAVTEYSFDIASDTGFKPRGRFTYHILACGDPNAAKLALCVSSGNIEGSFTGQYHHFEDAHGLSLTLTAEFMHGDRQQHCTVPIEIAGIRTDR